MKVICIRDVKDQVFEHQLAFVQGKTYDVVEDGVYLLAKNEQGTNNIIAHDPHRIWSNCDYFIKNFEFV